MSPTPTPAPDARDSGATARIAIVSPPPLTDSPVVRVDAGEPPGLRRTITPGALWGAARRRWVLAGGLGLLLAGLAAPAVWGLRSDKYTSAAVLRVASAEPRILPDANSVRDSGSYTRTQLALLRSRPVFRAALQDEKVRQLPLIQRQPDPTAWLEKELVVDQVPGTEVVRVSLTARGDGADLAAVVNAVVSAYMADVVRNEHKAQLAHLSDLQRVYGAVDNKLRALRDAFQTMSRDLKGGDAKILTLKQQLLLDEYANRKQELASVAAKVRDLELKIALSKLRLAAASPDAAQKATDSLIERDVETDPRVLAAAAEVGKLKDQLQQTEAVAVPTHTAELRKKVAAAEEVAEKTRVASRTAVQERHRTLTDGMVRQQAQEAEAELGYRQKERDDLQGEVTKLKTELDRIGVNSVELELKRGEIDRSEQFLHTVWEQKERLEVELKASDRQRVSVVAAAEDAVVLNKLGRLQEAAAAGAGGLLLGLFCVAVIDLRRNRIHTLTDVTRGLRLRVIGTLPKERGVAPQLPAVGAPVDTGSVDGLRAALLGTFGPSPAGTGITLMVASSEPGEGKTTLTAQLAKSLARGRRRAVLVDFDLRSPSLHKVLGLDRGAGVCEVLAGVASVEGTVRPTAVPGLDCLPAGSLSAEAEAGLAQPEVVRRLVAELRARYDYVIIDSSPILLVPDALALAGCVDGLLMAVRSGVSLAASVYAGYERLVEHRFPVLGVVVCGVPEDQSYARGYGYGRPAGLSA